MSNPYSQWIAEALTPGVALTCVILYNTSLQNRFVYITGRIRELNREARALLAANPVDARERVESLRWQVGLMTRRSLLVRRAVLVVYGAFLGFTSTMLSIAASWRLAGEAVQALPLWSFAAGLVCLVVAGGFSIAEMYLAQRTVYEDCRTTFPAGQASGPNR